MKIAYAFDNDRAGHQYKRKCVAEMPFGGIISVMMDYHDHKDVDDWLKNDEPTLEAFLENFTEISFKEVVSVKDLDNSDCEGDENNFKEVYVILESVHIPDSRNNSFSELKYSSAVEVGSGEYRTLMRGIKRQKRGEDYAINMMLANSFLTVYKIEHKRKWTSHLMEEITTYTVTLHFSLVKSFTFELPADEFASDAKLKKALYKFPGILFSEGDLSSMRQMALSNPALKVVDTVSRLGWNEDYSRYYTSNGYINPKTGIFVENKAFAPGEMNFEKKVIRVLGVEELQQVKKTLFQKAIYMHRPELVTLAISQFIIGWFSNQLVEHFNMRPVYGYVGNSSDGKTQCLHLGNSLDGAFNAHTSFASTINFIQRELNLFCDHTLLVDDYKGELIGDGLKALLTLIQSLFDSQFRGRMTDVEPLDAKGYLIFTAENSIRGLESIAGRVIEIPTTSYLESGADPESYNIVLELRQKLSSVKPELLSYCFNRFAGIVEEIKVVSASLRDQLPKGGNSDRIIYGISLLHVFSRQFLEFGVHNGVLSGDKYAEHSHKITEFLMEIAEAHIESVESVSLAAIYIDSVNELLESGKYRLMPAKPVDSSDKSYVEILGYHDADFCYILPQVSVKAVAKIQADNAISITEKAVRSSLVNKNFIPAKNVRPSFNGKQTGFWRFKREVFI